MKIVHLVLGKANPERANGVNRVAHGLATAQARAGADVELWGITRDPASPTPPREYSLRLFASSSRPWNLARDLEEALSRATDCVFHLHGGYHPEFHAAARRLEQSGIPWVLTPHGAYRSAVVRQGWVKKRLYLALFDSFLLRSARTVHVFSEREARELRLYAPRARTSVLPNGVDLTELAVDATPVERRARPVFGYCGRLAARSKGLDLLLEGFARHVETGGPGELWLVGEGPDQSALLELARTRGVEGRVRFLGPRFGAEKLESFAAMDVFLHPSRTEGMPVGVLEAAGTGLPCVLSRETNLGEALERHGAGIVLERNDPAEIAEVLAHCASWHAKGMLPGLGGAARSMVVQEFDWAKIAVRSFAELYGMPVPISTRAA